MNAEALLAQYERIAEAQDAIARLRRFVLDLAVRGKLVPQDSRDEPASELLKQIGREKTRLVRAGEIKAEKPLPPTSAAELGFVLPHGWAAVRLSEVAACLDFRREPINATEREKRIEGKAADQLYPYYGATQQQGWIDDFLFDDELVLLGEDGVPVLDALRPKAYLIRGKSWVNNHAHVFKGVLVSNPFLVHALNVFDYTGRVVGATRSKLNQARAVDVPLGLPPLAEQHRIVAKVHELMALCDRLEAARTAREATRDRLAAASLSRLNTPDPETFPSDARFALDALPALTTRPDQIKHLRQTILNLAVRGKLVPQDANDEPAATTLARFARRPRDLSRGRDWVGETEKPSAGGEELPPGWCMARVAETCERVTVGFVGTMKNQYVDAGIPFLRSQNVRANRFRPDGMVYISPAFHQSIIKSALRGGDVVVVRSGNVGVACVIPDDIVEANCSDLVVVQRPGCVAPQFLCFYLNSMASSHVEASAVGIALTHFNTKSLATMPIPLPPLAEQHRVVAKVNELMALCDALAKSLDAATTARTRLLDATLAEALAPALATAQDIAA